MSPRNLLFLCGLLVILFVMYLVVQRAERPAGLKEALLIRIGKKEWTGADEIRIWLGSRPEKVLRLKFSEGRWEIWGPSDKENFPRPAKEALIRRLLSDLASLSGEERARGKAYWETFDLVEEKALHLVGLRGERELFHLLIGKRGPYWESCFVRPKASESVYLVPENLLARFEIWSESPGEPSAEPWVEKTVLSLDYSDLRSLALFWEGKSVYLLKKEKEKWLLSRKGREETLSPEEVKKRLRGVFPLFAERVVAPESFQKEVGRLEVRGGRSERKLLFGRAGKEFLVKSGPYVYQVKAEEVKRLRELF